MTSKRLSVSMVIGVLALDGCSSLADPPPQVECTDDIDCPSGSICQLSECRDASGLPPVRYIGLDIVERSSELRVEVSACDLEANIITDAAAPIIEFPYAQLTQQLSLVSYRKEPSSTGSLLEDEVLPAVFELSQPSRFLRSSPSVVRALFPTTDGETLEPATIPWSRYHPEDDVAPELGLDGYFVWTTLPEAPGAMLTAPALRYQLLIPTPSTLGETCQDDLDCCASDENCNPENAEGRCVALEEGESRCRLTSTPTIPYRYIYNSACDRGVGGVTQRPDGAAIVGTEVLLRYADRNLANPITLAPLSDIQTSPCEQDDDCPSEDLLCNEDTGVCELHLDGFRAGTTTSSESGEFTGRVYTYCEADETATLTREFIATVTAPATAPEVYPTMSFRATLDFPQEQVPGSNPVSRMDTPLCLPSLGPAQSKAILLRGDPQILSGADASTDVYRCCDIDCLPATLEDVSSATNLTECTGFSTSGRLPTIRLESDVMWDDAMASLYSDADCTRPEIEDNIAGYLRRTADCTLDMTECNAIGIRTGADETAPTYRITVEMPVGSVFQSFQTERQLPPDDALTLELSPRPLLSGRVTLPEELCEDDDDCGSRDAVVLAERLAVGNETNDNTIGPYFHEVRTHVDPETGTRGHYTLPLDPGVYVVTALPSTSLQGGPAAFHLVDTRNGSSSLDLSLDPGILVRADLRSFDRNSQITPLDIGSWVYDNLPHPGRVGRAPGSTLDLNDPNECLGDDASGCRVRRLVAGNGLPPTQIGQVRFSARDTAVPQARTCVP